MYNDNYQIIYNKMYNKFFMLIKYANKVQFFLYNSLNSINYFANT